MKRDWQVPRAGTGRASNQALVALALAIAGCHPAPEVVWQLQAGAPAPTAPLVDGDIIAFGNASGVSIVGERGQLRCRFSAAGRVLATPRSDGQRLFFGATNHVFYAIDRHCQPVWRFLTGAAIEQAPEVVGKTVYLGSHDGHVYALDAASGALRWAHPALPADEPIAAPAAAAPALMAAVVLPPARRHRALGARASGRLAHAGARPPSARQGPPQVASALPLLAPAPPPSSRLDFGRLTPVAVGGILYAVGEDDGLWAIDAGAGTLLWHEPLGARVLTAPILVGGLIYVATAAGEVRAIDRQSHALAWRAALQVLPGSVPFLQRAAVAFVSEGAALVGFDPLLGRRLWQHPTPPGPGGSAAFWGPWTFMTRGSDPRGVVATHAATGAHRWRLATAGDPPSHVALAGEQLLVLAGEGRVTCLSLRGLKGTLSSQFGTGR